MNYATIKTPNGYVADEVISALQKEIRRGRTEDAAYWAYEMIVSGLEEKLWSRLATIAVEDVGLADPQAGVVIANLRAAYFGFPAGRTERFLSGLMGAVFLAEAPKDRMVDELYHCLHEGLLGKKEIPDYALDKHTARGRALGRGDEHFWTESSTIAREHAGRNRRYLALLRKKAT